MRVGKAIATPTVIWQPFASASVFHEFAGDVTSNYTSLNGPSFSPLPFTFNQRTTTSRVGTYGQYSLGLAGQIVNTGWLGFVRVDYRNGEHIDGWTGNAGIRYQFTPETITAVMPTKAPRAPIAVIGPTNWTGFYAGGFFGAAAGRTDIAFPASPQATNRPWVFGPVGGIQLGYNYQFTNNWVLGFEGDIGAADVHGGRSAGAQFTRSRHDFGLFRPAGQDLLDGHGDGPRRLCHGPHAVLRQGRRRVRKQQRVRDLLQSAGWGVMSPISASIRRAWCLPTARDSATSSTRVGWTIGYGAEFDLGNNWSAKAEYDYLSFGRHTALASDGTTIMPTGPTSARSRSA